MLATPHGGITEAVVELHSKEWLRSTAYGEAGAPLGSIIIVMLTVNVNRKLQLMLRYLQACPVTGMQVESPLQFQGQGYEMFLIPATGIGW